MQHSETVANFHCMTPAVILFVFNRPKQTAQVINALRDVAPPTVLLVADGPRRTHPHDAENCAEVRQIVAELIDWNPVILTHFAPENMGCRARVSTGLTWAFQHVDSAIILEDDIVPNPSFYRYAGELLELYKTDKRVGVIAGTNHQPEPFHCADSYYFSRYGHCWGWATWKRAWEHYDDQMVEWPKLRASNWINSIFSNSRHARTWTKLFNAVYDRRKNSWAYVWQFCLWAHGMKTILPAQNLTENIGLGPDGNGTNTVSTDSSRLHKKATPLLFPLKHPASTDWNEQADHFTQDLIWGKRPKPPRWIRFLNFLIRRPQ